MHLQTYAVAARLLRDCWPGRPGWLNTGSGESATTDNTKHICLGNVGSWKSDASAGCFLTAHKSGPSLTPVNYPEHYDGKREIVGLKIKGPDADQRVPLRSITSVNFTPTGYVPKIPKAFTLRNSKGRSLIKLIDFEHPVTMPGRVAGDPHGPTHHWV